MASIQATSGAQAATDFVALAELASRATHDPAGTVDEAARQFEALFVQMMLESMRAAGDVFGTGDDTTYRDMFDRQIALELTRNKGLGIAELLTRQLAAAEAPASPVRRPGAQDVVPARAAAAPAPPAAHVGIIRPAHETLLAAVARPAFEPPQGDGAAQSWSDWRPMTPEEFVRDVWPHAKRAGAALGVDARAIVAQAALETGWGRHVGRNDRGLSGNNPFNIKADAHWRGERISVRTIEFEDGLPRPQVASFRAYPDIGAAFADYVDFLKGNPRYAAALRHGADPGRFADSLQAAGYATDPDYAAKLRSILASSRFNELVGPLKNAARVPTS